jgi:serine/threonine-protein kinase HipA
MTPLYDVLSAQKAVNDGQIRQNRMRLAMSVAGHYRINEVVPRHFLQVAKVAGFGVILAEDVLAEVGSKIEAALDKTIAGLGDDFPRGLAETIADVIQSRTASLQIGIGG